MCRGRRSKQYLSLLAYNLVADVSFHPRHSHQGGPGIFKTDKTLGLRIWKTGRTGLRRHVAYISRPDFVIQFIAEYAATLDNNGRPLLPLGTGKQPRLPLFEAMLRSLETYVLECFEHEQLLAADADGLAGSLNGTINEFNEYENDHRTLVFVARGFLEKAREHALLLHDIDQLPANSPFKYLKRIKPRHLFRLFLDDDVLRRFAPGPWNNSSFETTQLVAGAFMFDQGEPGYIASILRGFRWLMRQFTDIDNFRLDAGFYENLHQLCFERPFQTVEAGFRLENHSVGYGLRIDNKEVSHEGAVYMQSCLEQDNFGIVWQRRISQGGQLSDDPVTMDNWNDNMDVRVEGYSKPRDDIIVRVDQIFDDLQISVDAAKNVNARCLAIAECVLKLNSHHVFRDGNGRLSVNILLPLLTMRYAGLYPTVPRFPNQYSGLSPKQLVEIIKRDAAQCKARLRRSVFAGFGSQPTKAYKFAKNRYI